MIHVLTTSKILKIKFKRCETGSEMNVFVQMFSSIDRHEKNGKGFHHNMNKVFPEHLLMADEISSESV